MAREKKKTAGGGSRPLRVGEAIRHALAAILRENAIHSPELAKRNITVTEVRMSPDLGHANVFVSPLGGVDTEGTLADLKKFAPLLRTAVVREVKLRKAPELHFLADESFDYAARIEVAFNDPVVAKDLGKK